MENNHFSLYGTLVRCQNFGKVVRGTVKVPHGERDEYIPFIAFKDTAKQFLERKLDSKVEFSAHLHSGSYEKDGKKIYTLEVIAEYFVD